MPSKRQRFVEWAIDRVGLPCLWAAKGDYFVADGHRRLLLDSPAYDCSGLVPCALLAVTGKDLRDTRNAQKLWLELPVAYVRTDELEPYAVKPGDLAFYGPGELDIDHVVIYLAGGHILSASGARPSITTLEDAKRAGARVQVKQTANYRPDLRGFRSLAKYLDSKELKP